MCATQVSVVIPVYNSEDCLDELVRRLAAVLDALGRAHEIVLVNDGSQDGSWHKIVQLAQRCGNLRGLNLRKNFGQDNAIMAGLNYCSGDAVVIMDDDLQHDPDQMPALLAELERGSDVCYAYFERKKQTRFKNFGSWLNGKVANIVLKKPPEIYLSPYKVMRREVVEEILKYGGPYPYVDGLIFRVTRNITQIPVPHHERFAGEGNYGLWKAVHVWLKLATNLSVTPLRLATFLGFLAAGTGFVLAAFFIIQRLVTPAAPLGWASLVVTSLVMGGIQLIALGVIGEYVGRLFLHQSNEPQYIVRDVAGRPKESA